MAKRDDPGIANQEIEGQGEDNRHEDLGAERVIIVAEQRHQRQRKDDQAISRIKTMLAAQEAGKRGRWRDKSGAI
ncbi:hypothetical protein RvVAR031_41250 [Agrobacterium vitis]|nr:hypothetical protein RvVAR031_41250 [Agrobacterium vitis]